MRGATFIQATLDDNTYLFQSTHPMRGATQSGAAAAHWRYDFNPRTPCGVRRAFDFFLCVRVINFNPRTPCGVRPCKDANNNASLVFQSTHPMRGATYHGDQWRGLKKFQSTHPMRGATENMQYYQEVR